jgi:hypothetical protein
MKRSQYAITVLGLALSFSPAQAQNPPAAAPAADPSVRGQLLRQSMEDAAALFAAGGEADAVSALAETVRQPANSPAWHMEMAHLYVQLAVRFYAAADFAHGNRLAQMGLGEAQTVVRLCAGSSPGLAANACETAGFICERLLGDPVAARDNYAAAVRNNPKLPTAQRALDRLNQALARTN